MITSRPPFGEERSKLKGGLTIWKRWAPAGMSIVGFLHGVVHTPLLPIVVMSTIAVVLIAATALFVSADWRERARWRFWLVFLLATDAGLCVGWSVGALVSAFYHGQGGPYFYVYFPLIP